MGIGTDLIRFFERTNGHRVLGGYRARSLKEFIEKYPEHAELNLYRATQKLVYQGYLMELDDENIFLEAHSWHNRRYFSQLVEEDIAYGTFDFFVLGKVIGVITHMPTNLSGEPLLGYGGAIPTVTLEKLLQACNDKSEHVQGASKQDTETGFKHVRRL